MNTDIGLGYGIYLNIPDNKKLYNVFTDMVHINRNYYWYLLCERRWKNIMDKIYVATYYDKYIVCIKLHNFMKKYKLSDNLEQLFELTKIYLYNNKLTYIPSELGQLNNLQLLYLYNNQLTCIPSELGQLNNLQELYLDNNQPTYISSDKR